MSAKKTIVGGCLILGMLIAISCGWLYWRLFPPCGQPPEDPNVEVIVSDCYKPHLSSTSQDGKYMIYSDRRGNWLKNLVTGEEELMSIANIFWLSDTLTLQLDGDAGHWQISVHDATDGTQTAIQWTHGREAFQAVLPVFQQAKVVYYSQERNFALALEADFKAYHLSCCLLTVEPAFSSHSDDEKALLAFLNDNQIAYVEIREKYEYNDPPLPSHDGNLLAQGSQITDLKGNIVVRALDPNRDIYLTSPITGWTHDDSGVYLQHSQNTGPISILTPLWVGYKDQPILKLKVPSQYLSPEALAAEEARQAQEQKEKMQTTWIWTVAVLVSAGLLAFGWHRRSKNT